METHEPEVKPQVRGENKIMLFASHGFQGNPESGLVVKGETLLDENYYDSNPEELTRKIESLELLARQVFPKPVWYRAFDHIEEPIIGWHGLRRSLEDPVFQCELRALRNLYDKGLNNITLMLPYVVDIQDFIRAKSLITFPIKLGVMVETPAAAMQIELFIKEGIYSIHIDLNSLTQLTLGIDADNPKNSNRFTSIPDSLQPMLSALIEKAGNSKIDIAVSGEACNNPSTFNIISGVSVVTEADNLEQLRSVL